MLEQLIEAGLLPGYAFAVDVVGLSVPSLSPHTFSVETPYQDAMQCDLKIALSEYAPGAEVVRGSFPNTYIYRSAGLYDPYAKAPDYSPDGMVLECADCRATALLAVDALPPDQRPECHR